MWTWHLGFQSESEAINHRYPTQKTSIAVAPEKRGPKRKVVLQPSIFWGELLVAVLGSVSHHEHYSRGMVQWYPQNSLSMLITGNESGSWKEVLLLGSSCSGALSVIVTCSQINQMLPYPEFIIGMLVEYNGIQTPIVVASILFVHRKLWNHALATGSQWNNCCLVEHLMDGKVYQNG